MPKLVVRALLSVLKIVGVTFVWETAKNALIDPESNVGAWLKNFNRPSKAAEIKNNQDTYVSWLSAGKMPAPYWPKDGEVIADDIPYIHNWWQFLGVFTDDLTKLFYSFTNFIPTKRNVRDMLYNTNLNVLRATVNGSSPLYKGKNKNTLYPDPVDSKGHKGVLETFSHYVSTFGTNLYGGAASIINSDAPYIFNCCNHHIFRDASKHVLNFNDISYADVRTSSPNLIRTSLYPMTLDAKFVFPSESNAEFSTLCDALIDAWKYRRKNDDSPNTQGVHGMSRSYALTPIERAVAHRWWSFFFGTLSLSLRALDGVDLTNQLIDFHTICSYGPITYKTYTPGIIQPDDYILLSEICACLAFVHHYLMLYCVAREDVDAKMAIYSCYGISQVCCGIRSLGFSRLPERFSKLFGRLNRLSREMKAGANTNHPFMYLLDQIQRSAYMCRSYIDFDGKQFNMIKDSFVDLTKEFNKLLDVKQSVVNIIAGDNADSEVLENIDETAGPNLDVSKNVVPRTQNDGEKTEEGRYRL